MKTLFSLGAISLLAACSSGTTTTVPGPAPTDTGTPAPAATNPNGVAYPTTNIGYAAHTRIPNLKFLGYKATSPAGMVDTSGNPVLVQLADFYNPNKPDGTPGTNGNTIIIHISAGSRWCPPCNMEASATSGFDYSTSTRTGPGVAADLASQGVVFINTLLDGFVNGTPATLMDLRGWVTDHQVNFTQVFNPYEYPSASGGYGSSSETNSLFVGSAVPWNADIDARSMEILNVNNSGFDSNLEQTLSALAAATKAKTPMQ